MDEPNDRSNPECAKELDAALARRREANRDWEPEEYAKTGRAPIGTPIREA